MMKKLFMLITVLGMLLTSNAQAARSFSLPANAKQIAKNIYDLGTGRHNGEQVRGYAFIHRTAHDARPEGVGNGGGPKASRCYAFIGSGAKWITVEDYMVDSTNLSGLSQIEVETTIATATGLWNEQVDGIVFGNQVPGVIDGADTTTPLDDKNEVYFSTINDSAIDSNNTIAVTVVWGIFSGPPKDRRLVEWDQVYNEAFVFGDASTNTGVMDALGIAAHEVGHAAGMGHPDSACVDETMFAYAAAGEIKKRDLNAGDIAGIQKLYK